MRLPFKKFLLDQVRENGVKLYENEICRYAEEFGFQSDDVAVAFSMVRAIKDEDCWGAGQNPKGKYFLIDEFDNIFWFISARDAVLFACPESKAMVGTIIDVDTIFLKYRRNYYNGYYFLFPEDFDILDEIKRSKPSIVCLDRDVQFMDIQEAATWLVNSGIAANMNTAKKQLEKHLNGETSSCYKLRFRRM